MHRYDPKTYSIVCFTRTGRRAEEQLASNYQAAREAADKWKADQDGTAVVLMCIYNNGLLRPCLPEGDQG